VKRNHFRMLLLGAPLCVLMTGQSRSPTPDPQPSVSRPIYITHVTLIDTETGRELPDRTVVISGERIAGVEKSKNANVPSGARVVNGRGKYLIPGLWDMHAHPLASERRDTYVPCSSRTGPLVYGIPTRIFPCPIVEPEVNTGGPTDGQGMTAAACELADRTYRNQWPPTLTELLVKEKSASTLSLGSQLR
jgi:hypothetical protein